MNLGKETTTRTRGSKHSLKSHILKNNASKNLPSLAKAWSWSLLLFLESLWVEPTKQNNMFGW